jgi:hypothetical protein
MNTKTLAQINGAARSVTIWAAGILLAAGQVVPYITPETLASLGIEHGPTATRILTLCGLIMAACRLITKKSLADKGGLTTVSIPSTPEQTANAIIQKPSDSAPVSGSTDTH